MEIPDTGEWVHRRAGDPGTHRCPNMDRHHRYDTLHLAIPCPECFWLESYVRRVDAADSTESVDHEGAFAYCPSCRSTLRSS